MTTLKKIIGEGGAGLDDSMGHDTLYDVLYTLITEHNALIASYNQLLTDYNAETNATHTTSTAVAVTAEITAE